VIVALIMALIVALMSLELNLKFETLLDGFNLAGGEVNEVNKVSIFIVHILVVFSFYVRRKRNGGVTLSLHIHREPGLRQRVRSHLHHHLLIHLTAIPCLLLRDRDVTATARLKRRNFLNIYVQRSTYCRRSEDFNGLNGLCDFRNSLIYFSLEIFLKVCIFSDRSIELLDHKQTFDFFVCVISFHFLSVKMSKVCALCLRYVFYPLPSCLGRSFQMKCLNNIELYTGLNLVCTKKYGIMNGRNYRSQNHNYYVKHDLTAVFRLILGTGVDKWQKGRGLVFSKLGLTNVHDNQDLLLICGDVESNPGPNELQDRKVIVKLMTQNCRGLVDRDKLRQLLKNKNSEFKVGKTVLALQETHLMNDLNISWSGNYVISASTSPHSAGCITYLNDEVRVVEVKQLDDEGHGHVIAVEGLMNQLTIIANIYAPVRSLPKQQEVFYRKLIRTLDEMEQKYTLNEPGFVVLGDFNLPLELDMELHNYNASEVARARSLAECLKARGLIDGWKSTDDRYTFKTSESRLDRILYRLEGSYKENLETIWTFTTSDHCLLKMSLTIDKEMYRKCRVISLPTYLLESKEALSQIRDRMSESVGNSNEHWDVGFKLEYLKMSLRTAVGEVAKIHNKKQKDELETIQRDIMSRMNRRKFLPLYAHDENNLQIDLLFERRNLILGERSKKLAEKAKTKWFYEGEKSNRYFLNLLQKRRSNVEIEKLVTDRGEVTREGEINEEVLNFYKGLYESGTRSVPDDTFFSNIEKARHEDVNKVMQPIQKEELYATLLTCADSAPGPDGIPYSYYKHFWNFFGDVLTQVSNQCVAGGGLPVSHKTSLLRLLPKVGKDLTNLTNWRPITLSNCDHKLITKCLARRLTNAVKKCLHPSQTAYLPGQQIQDNLRVVNIINKEAQDSLIVSLDARKAFDSVSHDYIRKILEAFGFGDFVPIFNTLYSKQKVNIALNNNILEGYEIRNGVKQGDSLSCIIFIMCMDPLIRNIEENRNIERIEISYIPCPKVVAYADDVTCIVDNNLNSLQEIFNEYERLSKASGLILNANKTEILGPNNYGFNIKYNGEEYRLSSNSRAKINGVIFDKDEERMKEENFSVLMAKINSMLAGWSTRGLSLLGRIQIYKTFGLSQVIYLLSVIRLDERRYKLIRMAFNNFLWGRDIYSDSNRSRISNERLNTPVEHGGFGMIQYEQILDGIACRQLAKLYDREMLHPLKALTIKNDALFIGGKSLTTVADELALRAHDIMWNLFLRQTRKMTNQQIIQDRILIDQIGEIDITNVIKSRWTHSNEMTELVFIHGCRNIRDIIAGGRVTVRLSKKLLKAQFLRYVKVLWGEGILCREIVEEKIMNRNGKYKHIYQLQSKEFRELLQGEPKLTKPKIELNFDLTDANDLYVIKSYLNTIKRLTSTKHKCTLLRIWNGDCLSRTRLIHMNLSDTSLCLTCGMLDTPLHVIAECQNARQVWQILMAGVPKDPNIQIVDYALGISDNRVILAIKAEVLKMLMHCRELSPNAMVARLKTFFLTVQGSSPQIRQIFEQII